MFIFYTLEGWQDLSCRCSTCGRPDPASSIWMFISSSYFLSHNIRVLMMTIIWSNSPALLHIVLLLLVRPNTTVPSQAQHLLDWQEEERDRIKSDNLSGSSSQSLKVGWWYYSTHHVPSSRLVLQEGPRILWEYTALNPPPPQSFDNPVKMPLTLIPPLFVNCHLPEDVSILLFDTYDDLQKRLGAKNQMKR